MMVHAHGMTDSTISTSRRAQSKTLPLSSFRDHLLACSFRKQAGLMLMWMTAAPASWLHWKTLYPALSVRICQRSGFARGRAMSLVLRSSRLISLARQGFRRSLTALAMRDYRSFSKTSFLRSSRFSGVMSSSTRATGFLPIFPNRALSSKMTLPVNVPSTCEPLLLTRSTLCSRTSGCHQLRFGSE